MSSVFFFMLFLFTKSHHPADDFIEDSGIYSVLDKLPLLYGIHQSRLFQQIQVMRNAGFRHAEPIGDLPRIQVFFPQHLQDFAAGGIV